MNPTKIRYLVFDVESRTDGSLAARTRYPEAVKTEGLTPEGAIRKWKEELTAETGRDFIPYTYQIPIAVVLAKVSESFELLDIAALSEVNLRPEEIVERFWRGWERYGRPTLVTFNGRSFDLPLLELAAFRYGLAIPGWFSPLAKNYDQPRSRYNQSAHIDLQDIFTNFGTTRFAGGLNLAANLIGKPGKMDVQGQMVEDMYEQKRFQEIEDYCRCDVLDTYFVFLRTRVLMGYLTLADEQKRVDSVRKWLEERAESCTGYKTYLEKWGRWQNPWENSDSGSSESPECSESLGRSGDSRSPGSSKNSGNSGSSGPHISKKEEPSAHTQKASKANKAPKS